MAKAENEYLQTPNGQQSLRCDRCCEPKFIEQSHLIAIMWNGVGWIFKVLSEGCKKPLNYLDPREHLQSQYLPL